MKPYVYDPQARPDFVMLGHRVDAETVAIIASTSLREAMLTYNTDTEEMRFDYYSPVRSMIADRR